MAEGYVSTSNSGFNSPVKGGGTFTPTFGAINFGDNATVGGTEGSKGAGEGGGGYSSWTDYLPWIVGGIVALGAIWFYLRKR
jgi:hypothetical protein